jgi:RecA-family ATPase
MKPPKISAICGIKFLTILLITTQHSIAQENSRQSVLDLSQKKFTWLINKQLDSLENLLDDNLMYIHSNGWIESKQDVLDDLRLGKLVYTDVKTESTQVRMYKGAALVTGKGRFSGVNNGNVFDLNLLYTEVYVLKKKKWLLASRHANRMP